MLDSIFCVSPLFLARLGVIGEYSDMNEGKDSFGFLMRQYLVMKIMFQKNNEQSFMISDNIT